MEKTAFSSDALGAAHLLAFVLDAATYGAYALEYKASTAAYHMAGSWHGRRDAYGKHMCAADVNAKDGDEQAELALFRTSLLPLAKGHGLAVVCGLGPYHVKGHSVGDVLHFHVDIGRWSNMGDKPNTTGYSVPWVGKPTLPAWPVRAFQKAKGLVVDGVPGPKTYGALQKAAGVPETGVWDETTIKAVQKMVGSAADGVAGPNTFYALGLWVENGCK